LRFKKVTGDNPSQQIVAQVRQMIASGTLAKGDRLPTERDFADALGISRNTIRKAITSLKQVGLVDVRKGPSGGAFISQDGGTAIRSVIVDLFHLGSISSENLTEARVILLPTIVRLACLRCTSDDIRNLEENVRKAEEAIAIGDLEGRQRLNLEFYHLLGNMAKNPVIALINDAVSEMILQFVRSAGLVPPRFVMPIRYRLIECFKSKDADAATMAMEAHLIQLEKLYRKLAAQRR